MKTKTLFTLLTCLIFISSPMLTAQEQQEKAKLNQLITTKGNELEVIAYLEGRGKINGRLGYAVAGIGDINQDGYDDVAIGNIDKGAGETLILFGDAEMDSIPDMILRGENEGDLFGTNLTAGGDINGDGASDFIIAAGNYPERRAKGRLYVYWGGALLDTIADASLTGENNHDIFGYRVTTGDTNDDNQNDVLISTVNYSPDCRVCGKTYLYDENELMQMTLLWANQGDSARTYFGSNIAIGDLNNDNRGDILITSSPNGSGSKAQAVTEIFLSRVQLDTISDFVIVDTSFGNLGQNILFSNDLNLDGFDDFVIRMGPQFNIYYGSSELDTMPDAHLTPWFGAGVNRLVDAGDVNGDGYPDILAGAWNTFFQSGSIGLYLGSENINPEVDWTAGGAGFSIDGAGDVNGDGHNDLIVSSISLPGTNAAIGAVWILAGRFDLEDIGTKVESSSEYMIPNRYELLQNYPNPFNAETVIRFRIANKLPKLVKLSVYDISGQKIMTLVDQVMPAGKHQIKWNGLNKYGKEVASGVYTYRLSLGQFQQVKKLVFMK